MGTKQITENIRQRIIDKLVRIYGDEIGANTASQLISLLAGFNGGENAPYELSEKDVVLITYADQVQKENESPLSTLHRFLMDTIYPTINSIHILPFYPYSSDDGFSVIDYLAVKPEFGTWKDVRQLGKNFRLMFDAVFNHISAQSAWFQGFLRGEAPYTDYFIHFETMPPKELLDKVVRPRALPLLTEFDTANGKRFVWTTFSDDQIDLNYANPEVLLEMIKILLFYIEQGATLIRLDAIAFLWKELGTSCIHLEQTHLIIQLMRDVLDAVAPHVLLITETNVPHKENISYFGDGNNEAQMVYQFPLPPLVLHTLHTGNATHLNNWAAELERISDTTTFFNFTASHDGIGLRPVSGILSDEEIEELVTLTQERGGRVSYRSVEGGKPSPYELNISYFDAITHPNITQENPNLAVQRFIVSQAIALAVVGVPGIYFHSLFGSRNYYEGVEQTGHNRSINREKLKLDTLTDALNTSNSIRAKVYSAYKRLLEVRIKEAAFHPFGQQRVLNAGSGVFAIERIAPNGARALALHHVRGEREVITLADTHGTWRDLLTGHIYEASQTGLEVILEPYQILWLKPASN
ncbi:MAG: sugar phosphorylase [Chloroflexi bacterium]|nr:MAG: sugar phosphorylase [Chloroflexota bacterium]